MRVKCEFLLEFEFAPTNVKTGTIQKEDVTLEGNLEMVSYKKRTTHVDIKCALRWNVY